jgi:hypothetical protein
MAESRTTTTTKTTTSKQQDAIVDQANDVQADERHVASVSGSNVDVNAGKQAGAVSERRAAEAQYAQFGDQVSAADQKAENAKIKLVTPEKGGVATGATGAPIQEGGSGVHGGVI